MRPGDELRVDVDLEERVDGSPCLPIVLWAGLLAAFLAGLLLGWLLGRA